MLLLSIVPLAVEKLVIALKMSCMAGQNIGHFCVLLITLKSLPSSLWCVVTFLNASFRRCCQSVRIIMWPSHTVYVNSKAFAF